jgi:hypothetical protein
MKRMLCFIGLLTCLSVVNAQKSIDNLFEKYAYRDGFVSVTINGNLLKLASILDDDIDDDSLPASISGIRILAQEDEEMKIDNFYDTVMRDINVSDYEEFMRVRESDQDLRMLVRTEGDKFKEFLLVAGGKDNVLIQIKGNMTLKEAKKFSADIRKNY